MPVNSGNSVRHAARSATQSLLYPSKAGPVAPTLPPTPSPTAAAKQISPRAAFDELMKNIAANKGTWIGAAVVAGVAVGGIAAWYARSSEDHNKKRMDFPNRKRRGRSQSRERSGDGKPLGVLIFHQCPRGRRTPCIAPFPLKFETFLRVYGINYEVSQNGAEPKQSGSPWISLDMEDIADMQNCFKFVCQKYGIDSDKGLSEADKSMSRAYTHLLENHLYW